MSIPTQVLVMAKAPVAGRVKTRLGQDVGMALAAELAAAALLDTLDACTAYARGSCWLALDGNLRGAVRGLELESRLSLWRVFEQVGQSFAERLIQAHAAVPGPVVQIGMDTPQLTPADLGGVASGLSGYDAVLAPAEDGGWWALALRDPLHASALSGVEMSTSDTYRDTLAALHAAGLRVGTAATLRDIDDRADAQAVAAATSGAFARAWLRDAPPSDRSIR